VLSTPRSPLRTLPVAVGVARRQLLGVLRMPSIIAPMIIFPVFLLVSFTSGFTSLTRLSGFPTDNFVNWYLPFVSLQSASFAGAGAGFGAARDITNGFFDRLLLAPGSRAAILVGALLASLVRACVTIVVVLVTGFALGARLVTSGVVEGAAGLLFVVVGTWAVTAMAVFWSLGVAYRAKSERAAPLFFIVVFTALFLSTAQVPVEQMNSGWLQAIARRNPISDLLRFVRQGFVTGISWSDTWPGVTATSVVLLALAAWAWTGLRRFER
jgi:ABC transporter DrrB family efflux protein